MNHTGAEYLDPAAFLAETATFAIAHEAINGYLAARLHEGEIINAEAAFAVMSEEAAGKFK